jgi:hypothetical protein
MLRVLPSTFTGMSYRAIRLPRAAILRQFLHAHTSPLLAALLIRLLIFSDSEIATRMQILNDNYAVAGLSFTLVNTTRTVNANWFYGVCPRNNFQTAMKTALHQGGKSDLNIYTTQYETICLTHQIIF